MAGRSGVPAFAGPLAPSSVPAWNGTHSTDLNSADSNTACSSSSSVGGAGEGPCDSVASAKSRAADPGMADFEADMQRVLGSLRGDGGGVMSEMSIEQLCATHTAAELAQMGNELFRGGEVERDQARAMALWRAAAAEGDVNARYSHATALRAGEGAQADPATAMLELRALAQEGHPWAQFAVASALRAGDEHATGGAPLALAQEEALALFKIAAANKVAPALFNIGNMYASGEGVAAPDVPEALGWYERAVESGDPQAMFHLGQRYNQGAGVVQDGARAFELHARAAEAGLPVAQYAVGTHYFMGTGGVSIDYGAAAAHYEDAAEAGLVVAMVNLAAMYREGRGVEQDDVRARQWFQCAASRNNKRAREALREMDDTKAETWSTARTGPL